MRLRSTDELDERWTLTSVDLAFVTANADTGKLGPTCRLASQRPQVTFLVQFDDRELAGAVDCHEQA